MPDPDHFRALLLLMRPFVLKNEGTHFGKVVNILRSRLDHPAFRTYLERQKAIFAGQRQQAMKLFSNGDGDQLDSDTRLVAERIRASPRPGQAHTV
jgi:hypothetical protein